MAGILSTNETHAARALIGASLLSAAATLPLHLLPLLVLALGAGGALPPGDAGWVGSAYMLGQLGTVLTLPACGIARVTRKAALAAAMVILTAVTASTMGRGALLLGAWLVVGIMAGVLQYLGNTTAAAAANRRAAFGLRMAASSITAAALMAWLQLSRAHIADYLSICTQFLIAFSLLSVAGLVLYRSEATASRLLASQGAAATPAAAGRRGVAAGLCVLFMLFVGQQGLWAVVMQTGSARGFALEGIVWMICLSKLLGAAAALHGNLRATTPAPAELLASGALVAIGAAAMGAAASTVVYVLGLLVWEVALNVLSAHFQASIAYRNPITAGMWITAAIFLGAASGHALAPYAAAAGHMALFVGLAVLTALTPAIWAAVAGRPDGAAVRGRHAAEA